MKKPTPPEPQRIKRGFIAGPPWLIITLATIALLGAMFVGR